MAPFQHLPVPLLPWKGSKVACGLAALTVGDDAGYAQLLGCLDGSVRQEEFLVYLAILHRVDVVQRRLVLLCLLGDAGVERERLVCFSFAGVFFFK